MRRRKINLQVGIRKQVDKGDRKIKGRTLASIRPLMNIYAVTA